MSTIPLPALSVQPPKDPLSQYAEALSVQSMIGQQKTQQLQQTGMQQENEQRQIQITDSKAMTSAMQEWDGKKFDDLVPLVVKHGGSANAVLGLKNNMLGQQEKYSKIAEQDATTQSKNLETLKGNNDMLLGHLNALDDVPDEQLVSRLQTEKNTALHAGYLDPDHAKAIDQLAETNDPSKIRPALKIFEKSLMGQKEQFDQAEKQAVQNNAEWKPVGGTGAFFNTRTNEVKTPAGVTMTPAQMESKYVEIGQKKVQNQPLTADEASFQKSYERLKELLPAFNIRMQTTAGGMIPSGGPGGGAGATPTPTIDDVPANIRAQVKQVLDYRGALPPNSRSNPVNQAIRHYVSTIDPGYDETTFPERSKILNQYAKDANDGQLGAINTSLGHLGELYSAAQALNQNNLPLIHAIASKLGATIGSDAQTTYTNILHRVSPELTSAYVKGGGGETERGANEADFALSKGQGQIISNIAESANLLNSKLDSKRNDWDKTFRPSQEKDKFENRWVTPAAKQVLDTLSAKAPTNRGNAPAGGGKFTVPIPGGKTYSFATQAAADAFKKEAGIQ